MARKIKHIYASDFETHADKFRMEKKITGVWAAAINEIHASEKEMKIFNNISSWYEYVKTLTSGSLIYFHNLKFDCMFIMCYLHKIGYKICKEINLKTNRPVDRMSFAITVSDMGQYYQLSVDYGDGYIVFRDSLKLVQGELARLGKDFGVEEKYWKLEEDEEFYERYREDNHTLTEEEIAYITNDVMCLCKVLCKLEGIGMLKKMTAASYALDEIVKCMYLDSNPDSDMDFYPEFKQAKNYFRCKFPELDNVEILEGYEDYNKGKGLTLEGYLRMGYKGGWCYNNTNSEVQEGKHWVYDVNSLFPSMMHGIIDEITGKKFGGLMPTGTPSPLVNNEIPKNSPYIVHICAQFELKKDHVPFLQLKKSRSFTETEWITSSAMNGSDYMELFLYGPDFELFQQQYDIYDMTIIDGYEFNSSETIFKSFVEKFYELKEKATIEGNKTERQRCKIVLNSGYGKMSTKPNRVIPDKFFDEDGVFHVYAPVKEEDQITDNSKGIYVPAGAYITAWARYYVISKCQEIIDNEGIDAFCYSDTDSLHTTVDCSKYLWIDKTKLGAWDCENDGDIVKARYVRQKAYIEVTDDEQIVKCCGLPEKAKKKIIDEYGDNLIDVFQYGFKTGGKKRSTKVDGGILLMPTEFSMNLPKSKRLKNKV